jgi:phospholipid/cholesterol/gamma-HCH transport system substrate-binding protein
MIIPKRFIIFFVACIALLPLCYYFGRDLDKIKYIIYFDSVSGLLVGNAVQYQGVIIGSVISIDLDQQKDRAKVVIQLKKSIRLFVGCTAKIAPLTLLSSYYNIVLFNPKSRGVILKKMSEIQSLPSDFDEILLQVASYRDGFLDMIAKFNKTIDLVQKNGLRMFEKFDSMIMNLSSLLIDMQKTTWRLSKILYETRKTNVLGQKTLCSLSQTTDQAQIAVANAVDVLDILRKTVTDVQSELTIFKTAKTSEKIDKCVGNIEKISEEFKQKKKKWPLSWIF